MSYIKIILFIEVTIKKFLKIDLKPENILVKKESENKIILKITDFELSVESFNSNKTKTVFLFN